MTTHAPSNALLDDAAFIDALEATGRQIGIVSHVPELEERFAARVEVRMERPALSWSGAAYFDTNSGDEPMERAFTTWDWARASLRDGTAILYADRITDSMRAAMDETERRRARQLAFNTENGITPRSVTKRIKDIIDGVYDAKSGDAAVVAAEPTADYAAMDEKALARTIRQLEKDMLEHARNLDFEKAAAVRDQLFRLRRQAFGAETHDTSLPPDANR